jgi:hypothetical protein
MTTALIVVAVWFLGLALFVVQKACRPRWEDPKPPAAVAQPATHATENRRAA